MSTNIIGFLLGLSLLAYAITMDVRAEAVVIALTILMFMDVIRTTRGT